MLAGAGAIAAAALVAAVVATGPDDSSGDGPDLEARIITASRSAVDEMIVHETTTWGENPATVVSETWRDEGSLSARFLIHAPDGRPATDWGQVDIPSTPPGERPPGTRPFRTVDYCNAEYTVEDVSLYSRDEVDVSVLVSIVDGLDDGSMHVDGTFHETYEYLPHTPDNLTQLRTADPPENFQHVAQLSGNHVESCN